jgi:hypothetical protein
LAVCRLVVSRLSFFFLTLLLIDRYPFDLGQYLRVGKAITPPDGLFASGQPSASQMPTAAALAAATITAQLQAKEIDIKPQTNLVGSFQRTNSLRRLSFVRLQQS